MKILIIYSDGNIGGAEVNLSKLVLNNSYEIEYEFLTFKSKGRLFNYFEKLGISPLNYKLPKNVILKVLFLFFYIKKNHIYQIYTCGFRVSLIIRLFKLLNKNLIITNAVRCNLENNNLREFIISFFEKKTSFLIDGYISNSQVAIDTYTNNLKIDKKKFKLIYNGIDQKKSSISSFENKK